MTIVGVTGLRNLWALKWALGIDENNTYQLQCFSSMKIVGAPVKIFTLALLKFLF